MVIIKKTMEILNINTLIEAVLILLLYLYYKLVPNNGKMLVKVRELKTSLETIDADITEIKSKATASRQELFEYMDGILMPLNKRMSTRLKREEKGLKDLESTQSRRGILGYRKKHGTFQ